MDRRRYAQVSGDVRGLIKTRVCTRNRDMKPYVRLPDLTLT